jgi:pyrimidine-nucleoside phosphorylase
VGNALEVVESIATLKGEGPSDVEELSALFAARMMVRAGVARSTAEGESLARRALTSGEALEKFRQIIERQGGDPRVIDDESRLPVAASRASVRADRAGFITELDAGLIGRASVALGAGRDRVDGVIDPSAGILVLRRPGDEVDAGDPVLELHYGTTARLEEAQRLAASSIAIGHQRAPSRPLVIGTIGSD